MKAMILAAGKGTRIQPITHIIPKPMIPILQKPVMEFLLELLKEHGFKEIMVNVSHLAEEIENYFRIEHGKVKSNCFIIDKKLAYISDVSKIYNKDYKYFKNLNYLVIDCLWYNFHPSHFNLENSLLMIKKFKPKNAILTNLSPVLDYKVLKKLLPKNVIPAHDGLTIKL